jgi:hypothetical protein
MTLPKNVAELQGENVVFELECIDRMYLNLYVPQLASAPGVAAYFRGYKGHRFASTKEAVAMSEGFGRQVLDFAERKATPIISPSSCSESMKRSHALVKPQNLSKSTRSPAIARATVAHPGAILGRPLSWKISPTIGTSPATAAKIMAPTRRICPPICFRFLLVLYHSMELFASVTTQSKSWPRGSANLPGCHAIFGNSFGVRSSGFFAIVGLSYA